MTSPSAHSSAPGVWRITVPLPFRPREVHAYLIAIEGRQFTLVDSGINSADAWGALDAGVRQVAGSWSHVTAHVVTHMHVDHFGLARRVREAGVPRLLMGRLDAERAAHADAHPDEEAEYRTGLLRENGAPADLWSSGGAGPVAANPLVGFVTADEVLDGQHGLLPGVRGWSFVWTPGHTAGHIALLRQADRLLIGGDAVLPRITPTIGVNRQRSDPVGDYLATLERLHDLEPALVLPGHGEPIAEPLDRFAALRDATQSETNRIQALLTDQLLPAWEITRRRYEDRDLPNSALVLALRETLAHLNHLTALRMAQRNQTSGVTVAYARV